MVLSRLIVAAALLAGFATPARAQIYTYRDGSGSLVLSNRAPSREAKDVQTYRVATPADAPSKRSANPDRAEAYEALILEHSRRQGVRESLVRAVIQTESAFNPFAVSNKGAMGLMQLMPATARDLGVVNPFSPSENVQAGVTYLRQLLDRYGDDEELALAAYNAGPGAVEKYGQSIPPYRETQNYVSKINDLAGPRQAPRPATRLYKSVEVVDGRQIIKYTDRPTE